MLAQAPLVSPFLSPFRRGFQDTRRRQGTQRDTKNTPFLLTFSILFRKTGRQRLLRGERSNPLSYAGVVLEPKDSTVRFWLPLNDPKEP
jgi:hypothetical protein